MGRNYADTAILLKRCNSFVANALPVSVSFLSPCSFASSLPYFSFRTVRIFSRAFRVSLFYQGKSKRFFYRITDRDRSKSHAVPIVSPLSRLKPTLTRVRSSNSFLFVPWRTVRFLLPLSIFSSSADGPLPRSRNLCKRDA